MVSVCASSLRYTSYSHKCVIVTNSKKLLRYFCIMLRLVVVLVCASVAVGRPEPPVGYSYSAPSTSYGTPSVSHSSGGYHYHPSAPIIQKHIYVHVPPPEPQEHKTPKVLQVAQPQKHYKIIFIKAPSPPKPIAPVIPIQPQNEEKTLVYVLVKKPEEQPDIVIPTPAPTQPSKPEVYFIKYQTQKEAHSEVAATGESSGGSDFTINVGGGADEEHNENDLSSQLPSGGSDSEHSENPSTQYGPPGYVAGTPHAS